MGLCVKTKPMSAKNVISFLVAALLSAITVYLSFAFLIISTFSLSGQTLQEVENEYLLYLTFWLLLAAAGAFMTFLFWKRKKFFAASGVGLVAALPVVAVIFMAYKSITTIPVSEDFVADVWSSRDPKPFLMAKSVVKADMLQNKTEDDVLDMLSKPTEIMERSFSERTLIYQTDSASWIMRVYLADQKVLKSDLYHPGLSN